MRILSVQETDWFQRGPHQQHHILERLAERGHEIRVIHYPLLWRQQAASGQVGYPSVARGIRRVTNGPGVTVLSPPFLPVPGLDVNSMGLSHFLAIRAQLRDFRPDVVVGYSILNSFLAMKMAKKSGIPFVYHIIDVLYELVPWRLLKGLGKLLEERNLKGADLVVGINLALLELATDRGADHQKCRLVRAGVDIDRFRGQSNGHELRRRLGIEDADLVLGYMGWVYPFSGLVEMLPSIAGAKDNRKRFVLLVIGDGEAVPQLLSHARSMGVQKEIKITGWQPYDILPSYLEVCDMFVFPALKRNVVEHIVPIKFYEYLAAGKPVIATRLEGISKEFDECPAVHLVDRPEDALPFALELLKDTSRYERDGIAARQFVETNCDWKDVTSRFEDCLEYVRA